MRFIESKQNETIKEICSLKDRKYREKQQKFIFEGIHLFEEYVRHGNTPYMVFATDEAISKYGEMLLKFDERLVKVSGTVYEKLTSEQAPQGILCVADRLPNIAYNRFEAKGGIILESVRDTGNLGGMIRTAASLGISSIVLSRDCADIYSSKTVRATMGAVFSTEIIVTDDVCEYISRLKNNGNRVFAACLYGKTEILGSFEISANDYFVFGNEGNGITEETAKECTARVIIPMSGKTESLNVAAASAVVMWEMVRNRIKP